MNNADKISQLLSIAQANKTNNDWILGVAGTGLKFVLDGMTGIDPLVWRDPQRFLREGAKYVYSIFNPPDDKVDAKLFEAARRLAETQMKKKIKDANEAQEKILKEEAQKAHELAFIKYGEEKTKLESQAFINLQENALIFQELDDIKNIRDSLVWYRPLSYITGPMNVEEPRHLWAAVDQIIKSKDGSELKSKLLHDVWENARNDIINAPNKEERASIVRRRFEQLANQDPRAYLASFHPDILLDLSRKTSGKPDKFKRYCEEQVVRIKAADRKTLEDEIEFVHTKANLKKPTPVYVLDKDGKKVLMDKGIDPQTKLINQMLLNKQLLNQNLEWMPNTPPKERPAKFARLLNTFKLNRNKIMNMGNDDTWSNNLLHLYLYEDADADLQLNASNRGLNSMDDWAKRKYYSDLWIQANVPRDQLDGETVENLRNKHFRMTQNEFNETVIKPMREDYVKKFKINIDDGIDLAKELYKDRKEISKLKEDVTRDQANAFLEKISNKTAQGDMTRIQDAFKNSIGFMNFDTKDPVKLDKEIVKWQQPLQVIDNFGWILAATELEKGTISQDHFDEFQEVMGEDILHRLPRPDSGHDISDLEYFDSTRHKKMRYQVDPFDRMFLVSPKQSKNSPIMYTDPKRVQLATDIFQEWLGSLYQYNWARQYPLYRNFGHEDYNVLGAAYPYPAQRNRHTRAMIKAINDKFYTDENFTDEYGYKDEKDRHIPYSKNLNNQVDKMRFAIAQLIENYGPEVGDQLNRVDVTNLTMDDLEDFEKSLATKDKNFSLEERAENNGIVFDKFMDTLGGGGPHTFSVHKHKNGKRYLIPDANNFKGDEKELSQAWTSNGYRQWTPVQFDIEKRRNSLVRNERRWPRKDVFEAVDKAFGKLKDYNEEIKIGEEVVGKNKTNEWNQFPTFEHLKDDVNFKQNVFQAMKWGDLDRKQLDEMMKNNPKAVQGVKPVRKLVKYVTTLPLGNDYYKIKRLSTHGEDVEGKVGGQGLTDMFVDVITDATGRDRNYSASTKMENLERDIVKKKMVVPRPLYGSTTKSIQGFPVGFKVDPDNPFYFNESKVFNLSRETAMDARRAPEARIKTRYGNSFGARVVEVDGVPVGPDPIAESRRANESIIYTKSMGDDPTRGTSFDKTGKKGTVSTPSKGFGVGEDRFERREDKRESGFESKQDEDDEYSE